MIPGTRHISVFSGEVHKWSCYRRIVLDELSKVVGQSKELSNFGSIFRLWPVLDYLNLFRVNPEATSADNVAEEFYLVHIEGAFFGFRVELIFLEYF